MLTLQDKEWVLVGLKSSESSRNKITCSLQIILSFTKIIDKLNDETKFEIFKQLIFFFEKYHVT